MRVEAEQKVKRKRQCTRKIKSNRTSGVLYATIPWWGWLLALALVGYLMQSPAGREYISKKEQSARGGIFKIIKGDTDPLSGFQQLQREMEFDKVINAFAKQRGELPDYINQKKTDYNKYLVKLVVVKEDKVFTFKQKTGLDKIESSELIEISTIPDSFVIFFTPEDRTKLTELRAEKEKTREFFNIKKLGVKVYNTTPELREKYNLSKEETGVVVGEVETGGPAYEVGISPGDIIRMVNHTEISNLTDFKKAMEKVKPGDIVLLHVRHGKWAIFVAIRTRK